MNNSVTRIAVTGGAGQIAYSLLFRLANGDLFNKPIALHILEVEPMLPALQGVKMELEDCAFPLLKEVVIGSDPRKVFEGVNWAFLVGAKPRGPGMERRDLLHDNGKIFKEQGRALNDVAAKDVRVLIVGNPCNTNCLIALHNAPNIPRDRFSAMMRLDQNRAAALIAKKSQRPVTSVSNLIVWGNHSTTQVPDFYHAMVDGKPAIDVIRDKEWFEKDFMQSVQNRGAEIIKARGKSSAASAASAAIDAMKALVNPENGPFSSGVYSSGNSYGIDENLVFSFPLRFQSYGNWEEVKEVELNSYLEEKIRASEKELIEERSAILDLIT